MAKPKIRVVKADMLGGPHNGEPRPDLQFPDPVNGEMIGGQVASVRMAMRYRHVVTPWARRQGKSKGRQFVIQNEATITPGEYYFGCCFPDHTTAAKIADNFRRSWGGMVKDYKINDKDQDRWIELHPLTPPDRAPPTWFTDPMKARWEQCLKPGKGNERVKAYFWSAKHPHYESIQGFPHHFDRVDYDECQQIHPLAYGITRPMIRDSLGHEWFSGTPWVTGIGNVKFEMFWDLAGGESPLPGWFRMRIPDGTNPHVPKVTDDEKKSMSQQEIDQTLYARFLTGQGAVFENLDAVFILPPMDPADASLDWIRAIRSEQSMPNMEWWIHHPKPLSDRIYGLSVDWARSPTGDYTAVTVFDFTYGQQVALFRWRGVDFTHQMEAVLAIQKHYGARQLHSDENGLGRPMSDFMRRRHALGFTGHNFTKRKEDYVTKGRVLFQDAAIALIDCPVQRDEFKSYSTHEPDKHVGQGTIQYGAPPGKFDDTVAAFLQLAPTITIVGRQEPPAPDPQTQPMFNEDDETTLELFSEGGPMPWDNRRDDDELTWDDVVLTR